MNPRLRGAQPNDLSAIDALIISEYLPALRTGDFLETFWVLEGEYGLSGCVGLEVYGQTALLRSVITAPELRGKGFGDVLVRQAFSEAQKRGVKRLYLFTMDKAPFFARHGFRRCAMDDFELAAQQCTQFQILKDHPEVAAVLTAMLREV